MSCGWEWAEVSALTVGGVAALGTAGVTAVTAQWYVTALAGVALVADLAALIFALRRLRDCRANNGLNVDMLNQRLIDVEGLLQQRYGTIV
jgi:hypothetical protein